MSSEETANVRLSSGLDQDLENARVLLEDHPWKDNPQKYRKMADVILRRILTVDPNNDYAKELLAKAEVVVPVRPEPLVIRPEPVVIRPEPPVIHPEPADFSFVVSPVRLKNDAKTGNPFRSALAFVAAIVIAGFLVFGFLSSRFKGEMPKPAAPSPMITPVSAQLSAEVAREKPAPPPDPAPVEEFRAPAVLPPAPAPPAPPVPLTAPPAKPAVVEVKAALPQVAPIQNGTLAVSSPTTVDIYMGDQFLGSAPTTLELPAGTQRLEYRHQDMRKVITHVIKPGETTTLMVTFDIPVQINAKPWAQVFIDGSQRQPLGQTPLSDVRVPIGSVLVFENPNFPGKRYRVTGKESEIRMSFP